MESYDEKKWTVRQKNIFSGLRLLGEEIAGFYKAGLKIYYLESNISNEANFLMHAAREIDGSIRNVLAADFKPEQDEEGRHKKSIISALGDTYNSSRLADDWYFASKSLHKFAHRHGSWKSPRLLEEVIPIWDRYELILERLLGSYYSIVERLERICDINNIHEYSVSETLMNILSDTECNRYFFSHETNHKWFNFLNEKGVFRAENLRIYGNGDVLFWTPLCYLERVSEQVAQNPQYGKVLIDIIDDLVNYSNTTAKINNYHIWRYCVKILCNLPDEIILENLQIDNFGNWLTTFVNNSGKGMTITDTGEMLLPKLLGDGYQGHYDYAEAVVGLLTEITCKEKPVSEYTRKEFEFVGDIFWIQKAFEGNCKSIAAKCSADIIDDISNKLVTCIEYEGKDYSQYWIKSLADIDKEEYFHGAEMLLLKILIDLLSSTDEKKRSEYFDEVLTGKKYDKLLFRRIVLLFVDKEWRSHKELFERIIDMYPGSLFDEPAFEVELYDILKNHNREFDTAVIGKIKKMIENIPEYCVTAEAEAVIYRKYRWLSPLAENELFKKEYEEILAKLNLKEAKPYAIERSAFRLGVATYSSPVSSENLLTMHSRDIVTLLCEFEGAGYWEGAFEGEPTKEGLAGAFEEAVAQDSFKFTDEIENYFKIPNYYLGKLVRGLKEAWNKNIDIDWKQVFTLADWFFSREKADMTDGYSAHPRTGSEKEIGFIREIIDLIEDGCKNDAHSFGTEYFERVERLYENVLPFVSGEPSIGKSNDILTYALNSTFGRMVLVYIKFSLHKKRVSKVIDADWGITKFERYFGKGIDANIWFGCYLPQMKYLDEEYTTEKIEYYSGLDTDNYSWQMFVQGYLSGAGLYSDIYSLMSTNYNKAIVNGNFDGSVHKRLVQHISIDFLNRSDTECKLEDGHLFWKMLRDGNTRVVADRWLMVAEYFNSRSMALGLHGEGENVVSIVQKRNILEFWKWTYKNQELIKNKLGDLYGYFLGKMYSFLPLMEKLDRESEKWLLLCTPFVSESKNTIFFIEYLTKFEDDESVGIIGKIFLKLLENCTPTYNPEHIERILRIVFGKGDKEVANRICDTYGRRGEHLLRNIWNEYNKGVNSLVSDLCLTRTK
ncbi:MAG: hypothetical protein WCP79_13150 [Bacillota bacterium]